MQTIVYIDGFNLYYRALRHSRHKWLDISAMSKAALGPSHTVTAVKYYTARISGRTDRTAPARQHAYLRALSGLQDVHMFFGNFLSSQKFAGLVKPYDFRPPFSLPDDAAPDVAYVWRTEEKGSDVNLGVHLVRDAFRNQFEAAAVLTNDTDLTEPIRIVVEELGFPVTLLTPSAHPATSLARLCRSVRHIDTYLGPCQLPNPAPTNNGKLAPKPRSW